jgi:hypothetical protein
VIAASGLKYVGVGTTALGWILCGVLLAAAVVWLLYVRPLQSAARADAMALADAETLGDTALLPPEPAGAGPSAPAGTTAAGGPASPAGASPAAGETLPGPHSA